MAIATLTSNESGANSLIDINANFVDLDTTKADLASPTFTGTPNLPTGTIGVTQSASNNSTKLATTAYVDAQIPLVASVLTIETTTGVTHSLTTTASQKVIIWAKGIITDDANPQLTLKYNGVTKDALSFNGTNSTSAYYPFSMMYTETPGAGTQNIVVGTSGGTLYQVVIIVMKIG